MKNLCVNIQKKKSFYHELRKGVWIVESNKDAKTINLKMEGTSLKLKSETERDFHEWNSIFLLYEVASLIFRLIHFST